MNKKWMLVFVLGLWLGCDSNSSDKSAPMSGGTAQDLGGVAVMMPGGWVSEPPSNAMRKAQYKLPSDTGDAELVVTHFGTGGAGGVDANIERWKGQFSESDGGKISKETVSGMPVTLLDIRGSFVGMQRPMGGTQATKNGQRMLAAIVETSSGAFYFKLVGPDATVTKWEKSFDQFVKSMKPSGGVKA
jgi:hypothetical protein